MKVNWIERNEKALLKGYTIEDKSMASDWTSCAVPEIFDIEKELTNIAYDNDGISQREYIINNCGKKVVDLGHEFDTCVDNDDSLRAVEIYIELRKIKHGLDNGAKVNKDE